MIQKKLHNTSLLKWLLLSAVLLVANFYLTSRQQADGKNSQNQPNSSAQVSVIAEKSNSNDPTEKPIDVTGKNGPSNHSTTWLVAIDLVNPFGKSLNQKPAQSTSSEISVSTKLQYLNASSALTVCQVNAELGRLFTLVGERPSGTS